MYDDILIATDGSDVSLKATEHGVDIAGKYGARVHALHVVNVGRLETMSLDVEGAQEELREAGQAHVRAVVDAAEDAGLEADGDVVTGHPSEQIVEYAEDNGIDLIVMGTHGRSGLSRVLGSVAERVVRNSPVPVHVVGGDE